MKKQMADKSVVPSSTTGSDEEIEEEEEEVQQSIDVQSSTPSAIFYCRCNDDKI
jgi:hypothetical protein